MRKFLIITFSLLFLLSCNVFASESRASVKKISENLIEVFISSDSKIKVTGYIVNKGNNITIYYIKDNQGKLSDSIRIDLNTIVRPYKINIVNGDREYNYQPFEDIKNHSMKEYIRHLFDLGFINGYEEDNTFRPNNNITRGELITLISRIQALKQTNSKRQIFEDLSHAHWAYDDALKAIDNSIIEGYKEDNKYYIKLDNNITLAETIKVIDSAFKINNKSVLNYDVRFVKHWAKENIQSLLNSNIISPNDRFYINGDLNRPATRAEVAMMLSRAVGR